MGLGINKKLVSKIGAVFAIILIMTMGGILFSFITITGHEDILAKQEADGVIINIAGRQRMLSQKMTKESLLISAGEEVDLESTKKLFDTSLNGLIYGNEEMNLPPTTDETILTQMNHVESLWDSFKPNIETIILGNIESTEFEGSLIYVKENNVELLTEMNKAVGLYETSSKAKVDESVASIGLLKNVLLAYVVIVVILVIGGLIIINKSVVKPVNKIASDIKKIGDTGNLNMRTSVSTNDEIGQMATSLNSMLDNVVGSISDLSNTANAYSRGDQTVAIDPKVLSQNNEIGNLAVAFDTMMKTLNEKGEVLNGLIENVDQVANGDLTVTVDETLKQKEDKTGILANAIDKMISSLRNVSIKINESAKDVLFTSEKLAANTEEVTASSEQASSSIQEIAKGSQDLSRMSTDSKQNTDNLLTKVKGVSDAAKEAAEKANKVNELAETGGESAVKASEKMNSIKDSVASSAMVVSELGNKSQQIHKVIEVINSISEQTNLLALNAAIEAARAGEAGRGFAVVADEVRKLAEESSNATKQIDAMILEITDATDKAVTSMQNGTKEVHESSAIVNEALKSLGDITTDIAEVKAQMEEINASTNAQMRNAEEVQKAIDEVSAVAEQSAAGAQEVSSSIQETTSAVEQIADMSQHLTEKAKDLKEIMKMFKLDTDIQKPVEGNSKEEKK